MNFSYIKLRNRKGSSQIKRDRNCHSNYVPKKGVGGVAGGRIQHYLVFRHVFLWTCTLVCLLFLLNYGESQTPQLHDDNFLGNTTKSTNMKSNCHCMNINSIKTIANSWWGQSSSPFQLVQWGTCIWFSGHRCSSKINFN